MNRNFINKSWCCNKMKRTRNITVIMACLTSVFLNNKGIHPHARNGLCMKMGMGMYTPVF